MIFVTVGTHEQPFNRLIEEMDRLAEADVFQDKIIIQTGFSTYEPKYCRWQKLFSYQEMIQNVADARIVITHGGPSSFIMPLQIGKIPIVVPRKKMYNEHVNDHQVDFSKAVAERQGNIIVVEDINTLKSTLINYESIIKKMTASMQSNNEKFNRRLEEVVERLFRE